MKSKFIIIFIAVLIFVILYWTRYQVVEIHATGGAGFYTINRFTGEIKQVAYQKIYKVTPDIVDEALEKKL